MILLDEAFSGVDVGAQEEIVKVLQSLRDEGRVVLLATHDLTNLAERFDQVLCLNHHVCACGPPEDAFTPEVMEEMYGSHGIEFDPNHFGPWQERVMIDYIVEPFQYSFMVRALIVSVLVGVMCPVLGAYVITRGRAFMGDALAHSRAARHGCRFPVGNQPFLRSGPLRES